MSALRRAKAGPIAVVVKETQRGRWEMHSPVIKLAAIMSVVGAAFFAAGPAFGGNVVTNPSSSQVISYGNATVQTIIQMASGATQNPFVIKASNGATVFAVAPSGRVTAAGNLSVGGNATVAGGLKAAGNVIVGSGKFKVSASNGSFSADAGQISSDGAGDLSIGPAGLPDFIVTGADGSFFASGGNFIVNGDGSFSSDNGQISSDGGGDLIVGGSFSSDNGFINTDGAGDFDAATVTSNGLLTAASIASDAGAISSDGIGDLTVAGLTTTGPVTWTTASDPVQYDLSGGGQALTTDDVLINRLAIVSNTGNTLSTPDAADLVAAIPNAAIGNAFSFTVDNYAGSAASVGGGTGVTLNGGASVPAGGQYTYSCVLENVTAGSEAVNCF